MEKNISMGFNMDNKEEMNIFANIQKQLIEYNKISEDGRYEMKVFTEDNYLFLEAIFLYYDESFNEGDKLAFINTWNIEYKADLGDGKYEYYENKYDMIKAEEYAKAFRGLKNGDDLAKDVYERIVGVGYEK